MPLPFPLWWIAAGLAGTATVGGLTKSWRKTYIGAGDAQPMFPPSTAGNAITRARDFVSTIKDFGVLAAKAKTPADFNKLAEEANAQYAAEKKEAIAQSNKLIDDYKKAGTTALLYSGVGVVAIPFIYFGAELLKYGANLQVWLIETLGLYESGWTDFWKNDAQAHVDWYVSMGIPFPEFKKAHHASPMGYVKSVLYPLHLEVDTLGQPDGANPKGSPNYQAIKRMGASFKKHSSDNPAVLALYGIVGESDFGLNNMSYGVPDQLIAGDLSSYSHDPTKVYVAPDRKFTDLDMITMLTAAIATTVAQDYGVPYQNWDALWKIAIRGFGYGLKAEQGKGHLVDAVFGMMNAQLEAEWYAVNKLGGKKPLMIKLPFLVGASS